MGPDCLHCQVKPARPESKFCSEACRDEFAQDMAEAISCHRCDAQTDGIADAVRHGWTEIDPDPEGTTWNYLGLCPDCRKGGSLMTTAEFRSKPPHNTCWLRLQWEGQEPTALVQDLEAAGWRPCHCQPLVRLPGQPDCRDFEKSGTGLFRGWTPAERRANLHDARLILGRHGLLKVPVQRLTLADLI